MAGSVRALENVARLLPMLLLFLACGLNPCENTLVSTVPSPDGRWQAVLFERSCGATTGFSTQVSIIPAGKALPPDAGNTFYADGGDVSAPWGGPPAELTWLGPDRLQIAFHPSARVNLRNEVVNGVSVSYRSAP
jgi:hypothetical protein